MSNSQEQIREIHIYIHEGEERNVVSLALEIVKSLRPNCLLQSIEPKIFMHNVTGEWPPDMLAYAYANLRGEHGIILSDTNCSVEKGSAYGKEIYVVYLK